MSRETIAYLFCLAFYTLSVGGILLVTGWDALGLKQGDNIANVVIIMALSFFPALFARPFFLRLQHLSMAMLNFACLLSLAVLIVIEYYIMHINLIAFFITHFSLWTINFIIMNALEKWYVNLSSELDMNQTRKLSGISTCIFQVGFLLGPLLVMVTKPFGEILPYLSIGFTFVISAIFASIGHKVHKPTTQNITESLDYNINTKQIHYIIAFALIWPTLNILNMAFPILARSPIYHSINVSGTLEITMGLATAIAGIIHPYLTKFLAFRWRTLSALALLILASFEAYFSENQFIYLSIGIFLVGISFGYFRVEIRAHLAKRFDADQAGKIIAIANSWCGPLALVYAGIFYLNTKIGDLHYLTLTFPISFTICGACFVYLLFQESNLMQDPSDVGKTT